MIRFPYVHGVIRRRLLVNFRVDPDVIQRQLPAPFRPKLHDGAAIAGICLIRLEHIRPKRFPSIVGISSENAAHRIAVTFDDREGVYIPRRDTDSWLNAAAGGRLFPGEHHRARFTAVERDDHIDLRMKSVDGSTEVHIAGAVASTLPPGSVFATLDAASRFFEPGALGYSATREGTRLDGIELHTLTWKVEALAVEEAYSSFFADQARFPPGSAELDCALIMRNIEHEWHAAGDLYL